MLHALPFSFPIRWLAGLAVLLAAGATAWANPPPATPALFEELAARMNDVAGSQPNDCRPVESWSGNDWRNGPLEWPSHPSWADGASVLLFFWTEASADAGSFALLRLEGDKHVVKSTADGDWGALNSKVALHEGDDPLDPTRRRAWETDETLKMPVAGPLFLFGQLGASSPSVEQQQHKWLGRTGVGLKLKPWFLEEVQVRGGPVLRYDDTSKLKTGQSPERSEVFLEAVTKVPLPVIGPLNVEYSGFAVPAVTPADRHQINQDVRLAKPLSGGSEFHLGAKYRWEDTPSPTPWLDRMQVYVGLQLKR